MSDHRPALNDDRSPGPQGDQEEEVRRVARLEHVEPALTASPADQPGGRKERVGVLDYEAERATTGRVRAVLQQRDAVENLVARVVSALRADDRDVVSTR